MSTTSSQETCIAPDQLLRQAAARYRAEYARFRDGLLREAVARTEAMRAAERAGMTHAAIADALGISVVKVTNAINLPGSGTGAGGRDLGPVKRSAVLNLVAAGMSIEHVAVALRVSQRAVRRALGGVPN